MLKRLILSAVTMLATAGGASAQQPASDPHYVQIGAPGGFTGANPSTGVEPAQNPNAPFATNVTITLPNGSTTNVTLLFDPAGAQNNTSGGVYPIVNGGALIGNNGLVNGNGLISGFSTNIISGFSTNVLQTQFGPIVTNTTYPTNVTGIYPTNSPGRLPSTATPVSGPGAPRSAFPAASGSTTPAGSGTPAGSATTPTAGGTTGR
jgi:hypothetical protein